MSFHQHNCPLCEKTEQMLVHHDKKRSYLRCSECQLIFVPPNERLDATREKKRYDLHQNNPQDLGYRKFLTPMVNVVIQNTSPNAKGLDFGCGPGPVLAMMLRETGRSVDLFDPFYALDESIWSRQYDFITASEVFEHLHRPGLELNRLVRILLPGGLLAVMTSFTPPLEKFATWKYINDETHVCFYSRETFAFIAQRWDFSLLFPAENIALLKMS